MNGEPGDQGPTGTKDQWGLAGGQQFVKLYALFSTPTFCIVVYYIPPPVMASRAVITTLITTSSLSQYLMITSTV